MEEQSMQQRFGVQSGYISADSAAEQRAVINRVYGWMTAGLAITGVTAHLVSEKFGAAIFVNAPVFYGILIAEVLLVVALSGAINKITPAVATILFLFYAVLNGVSLSAIFLIYTNASITSTFLTTSLTFGVMGLYGWATKQDLTGVGNLCFMALFGLIIAGIVNIFWRNSTMELIISGIGVLVFVGLTAYDTQKIKQLSCAVADGTISRNDGRKLAIIGALELYLDFINLFLYMLRFLGKRK